MIEDKKKKKKFEEFCERNSEEEPWGMVYKLWSGERKQRRVLENMRDKSG